MNLIETLESGRKDFLDAVEGLSAADALLSASWPDTQGVTPHRFAKPALLCVAAD